MAGVNSGCRSIVFPQLLCSAAPVSLSNRSKFFSKQVKNSVGEVEVQIDPLLMSALDNMRGHLQALVPLITGKEPRYLPKRRVIGSQSRSGPSGKEKNLLLV